jgi:hypothetical protein
VHCGALKANGIDRIDPSNYAYQPGNVLPCCKNCNFMRRTTAISDFYDHMSRIHVHQLLKGK